jgi:uncharacterized protein
VGPEIHTTKPALPEKSVGNAPNETDPAALPNEEAPELRDLYWALVGPHGLRAGWRVLLFFCLFRSLDWFLGSIVVGIDPTLVRFDFSPWTALAAELIPFVATIGAGAIMLRIERRRSFLVYNLADSRMSRHFLSGLVVGFGALSALVGTMVWGGWMRFGNVALSGSRILGYAALWGSVFVLVGCVEEGTFRCYALSTLARGISFGWALALVSGFCLWALAFVDGQCVWGVYLFAFVGLIPCLLLHVNKIQDSNFWHAAWATSTGFGFVHTLNNGENWIGIFAAAAIGFVFCLSIRLTGSAWWAIGCHAAWDWGETYFYGTADSGFVAKGHYLTTVPAGNPLWSGGADGPEGSLLIVPIVLLMLGLLLAIYGRRGTSVDPALAAHQPAG